MNDPHSNILHGNILLIFGDWSIECVLNNAIVLASQGFQDDSFLRASRYSKEKTQCIIPANL